MRHHTPRTATSPLGYTGAYTDPETGYLYLINRYYDPTTAQFTTVDPLESITGSAYGYVDDNPFNGTDPNGLCHGVFGCIGSGLSATGGAIAGAADSSGHFLSQQLSPSANLRGAENIWNASGGKIVHLVDQNKAAFAEIGIGAGVAVGLTLLTFGTGGLDLLSVAATSAAEEVEGTALGESAVGLFGMSFPLDLTTGLLLPVGLPVIGGLGVAGYGAPKTHRHCSTSAEMG